MAIYFFAALALAGKNSLRFVFGLFSGKEVKNGGFYLVQKPTASLSHFCHPERILWAS
jgi:hypothetical protein